LRLLARLGVGANLAVETKRTSHWAMALLVPIFDLMVGLDWWLFPDWISRYHSKSKFIGMSTHHQM
jgi:hypothetical protein